VIELGEHRLLYGDARDEESIKRLIGNDKIRTVLTDIPYGIDYVNSKSSFNQNIAKPRAIENDQVQSESEYIEFNEKWLKIIIPFLEKKNSVYIFNSDKMLFALREAMLRSGLYFSQLLVWIKNSAVMGRLNYLPMHELIAVGWYGTHLFRKSQDKSVLFCPKPSKSKLHPTMKPVPLLRRMILNSSDVGDVIYDPFGGSGSTLIACEHTKRKCLMVEIDKEYCQTIIERYNRLIRK
jgi:DNA modification methylase